MRDATRETVIAAALLAALAACGDDGAAVGPRDAAVRDQDAATSADAGTERPAPCAVWCGRLIECGFETYDRAKCEEVCPDALETAFLDRCVPCLEATACGDLAGSCFSPGDACHRPPAVGLIMSGSGFQAADGAAIYGSVVDFAGTPTGGFAESRVAEGRFVLDFGGALAPGLPYTVSYYADTDGDGVCDPQVDQAWRQHVRADEPLILLYSLVDDGGVAAPEVCSHFSSLDELCNRRCAREVTCGIEMDLALCKSSCEGRDSPAFLAGCIECLEGRACEMVDTACRQPGGACNQDLPPPTATIVVAASGFDPYEGARVNGVAEGPGERILTRVHTATITGGRFTFDFGRVFWPGQTYGVLVYVDTDGDSACSAADPGWAHQVAIAADSIFVLSYLVHDMAVAANVCDRFD